MTLLKRFSLRVKRTFLHQAFKDRGIPINFPWVDQNELLHKQLLVLAIVFLATLLLPPLAVSAFTLSLTPAEDFQRLQNPWIGMQTGLLSDENASSELLPHGSVTQEIVGQVQQLLEGSTEGAGLRGRSAEGLDWSRAEVLRLDGDISEGEEVEALVVIPAVDEGTEGQALWGRKKPSIDTKRALYAGVTVKKQPAGGSPRYQVTSKTPVAKAGSAVPAKEPPVICPYRYYGQTAAYRSLLCQWWEGKAFNKIKQFFQDLTLDVVSDLLEALEGISDSASTLSGISNLILRDSERSVILAGWRNEYLDDEVVNYTGGVGRHVYHDLRQGERLSSEEYLQ